MRLFTKLRRTVKREITYYHDIMCHDDTPVVTRILHVLAILYLLIPIDAIPDYVSILGHVDDVVLVSLMVFLAVNLVPQEVADECESRLWHDYEWKDNEWEEIE